MSITKEERTVAYRDSSKIGKLRNELNFKKGQLQEHLSIISKINAHLKESFQTRAEVDEYLTSLGYEYNLAFGADSRGFKPLYEQLVNSTRPEIDERLVEVKNLRVTERPEAIEIIRAQSTQFVAQEYQNGVELVQEFLEKFNNLSRHERRALNIHNGDARYNLQMLAFVH